MELSKRLNTIASFVTEGCCAADIGTDHGYIPIYLVRQGICPRAFAMDINAGPLERAKQHIAEMGAADRINFLRRMLIQLLLRGWEETLLSGFWNGEKKNSQESAN